MIHLLQTIYPVGIFYALDSKSIKKNCEQWASRSAVEKIGYGITSGVCHMATALIISNTVQRLFFSSKDYESATNDFLGQLLHPGISFDYPILPRVSLRCATLSQKLFCICILGPIREELIFRSFQRALMMAQEKASQFINPNQQGFISKALLSPTASILATNTVFALWHLKGRSDSYAFIQAIDILLNPTYASLHAITDNMIASIFAHILHNSIAMYPFTLAGK